MELIELAELDNGSIRDHLGTLNTEQLHQVINRVRVAMTNPLYADDEPLAARIAIVEQTAKTVLADRT